jgi:hypothetical protein
LYWRYGYHLESRFRFDSEEVGDGRSWPVSPDPPRELAGMKVACDYLAAEEHTPGKRTPSTDRGDMVVLDLAAAGRTWPSGRAGAQVVHIHLAGESCRLGNDKRRLAVGQWAAFDGVFAIRSMQQLRQRGRPGLGEARVRARTSTRRSPHIPRR